MILVDTSVLIGYMKGHEGSKALLFDKIISRDIPFGISVFTYQEVLQGARDESELIQLKEYLSSQTIYYPRSELVIYNEAATAYYTLRRRGITLGCTLDCLIALIAIENDLALLHDDSDFDYLAEVLPELKILTTI
ncbi:MAG: PIN domain nuclease [Firmicutes bacterium]|nr:PIN domain nuclease [Bacillota bacterium]